MVIWKAYREPDSYYVITTKQVSYCRYCYYKCHNFYFEFIFSLICLYILFTDLET